jgi:hypothetical protein
MRLLGRKPDRLPKYGKTTFLSQMLRSFLIFEVLKALDPEDMETSFLQSQYIRYINTNIQGEIIICVDI